MGQTPPLVNHRVSTLSDLWRVLILLLLATTVAELLKKMFDTVRCSDLYRHLQSQRLMSRRSSRQVGKLRRLHNRRWCCTTLRYNTHNWARRRQKNLSRSACLDNRHSLGWNRNNSFWSRRNCWSRRRVVSLLVMSLSLSWSWSSWSSWSSLS